MSSKRRKDSKFVKCPFFHAEDRQKIYCEGVSDATSIHLSFVSPKVKQEYQNAHCNREYCQCRIFRMNDQKYDEHGKLL